MLKINAAGEPATFDVTVRQPGLKFLATIPAGKRVTFRGREHWRKALNDLHNSYNGICAYTCHYVPLDTGGDTVEHFEPKSLKPKLAYEWSNFRFVCSRMNGRKGKFTDVVDPFLVHPGMFEIQFPSLQVKKGTGLPKLVETLAESTISRLKLNQERNIRSRLEYVARFRDGLFSLNHLKDYAPFIWFELKRQGLTRQMLVTMMPH